MNKDTHDVGKAPDSGYITVKALLQFCELVCEWKQGKPDLIDIVIYPHRAIST